jgi:hypothetical protein
MMGLDPGNEDLIIMTHAVVPAEYTERGGLSWGPGVWSTGGASVSWPFVTLRATPERLVFTVKMWPWLHSIAASLSRFVELDCAFAIERTEIDALRRRRFLYSTGLTIEHRKADFPAYFVYWPFSYSGLRDELRRLGYDVTDARR